MPNAPLGPLVAKIALAVGAVAVVATGTFVVVHRSNGAPEVAIAGAPRAWIELPASGSVLPDAPMVVLVHATDPDGIRSVSLAANDQPAGEATTTGDALVTAPITWDPPSPGEWRLVATGIDTGGNRTAVGSVHITVRDFSGGSATSSTTTTTEATTSSTTTSSSTTTTSSSSTTTSSPPPTSTTSTTAVPPTTCVPSTPVAVSPADAAFILDRHPTFTWTAGSCDPANFTVQISRDATFATSEVTGTAPGSARSFGPIGPALTCHVNYWWRVAGNSSTGWATANRFIVNCPVP